MTMTAVTVEVDWTGDPGDALSSATWVDETSRVREGTINRGRQRQLDQFQPGTCRIVLDNSDGRFDPNNTSSPLSPNVKPMKRVRVTATDQDPEADLLLETGDSLLLETGDALDLEDVPYVQFVGYIEEFELGWRMPSDGFVVLDCVDAFAILARKKLPPSVFNWEVKQDAPDRWYRTDETSGTQLQDSGSDGSAGTYVGSPTLGAESLVEGDPGSSVELDSTETQYATFPLKRSDFAAPYTLEFITRMDEAETNGSVQLFYAGGLLNVWLEENQPSIDGYAYHVDDQISGNDLFFAGPVVGQTVHTVIVVESGGITLYRDGVTGGNQGTASPDGTASDGLLYFGNGDLNVLGASGNGFFGRGDEVVFYRGVALSAARAQAHSDAALVAWDGDTSGVRIGNVLDVAGWPSADRDLDTGNTTFGPADIDGSDALAYIQLCEASENGHFFVTRDGQTRFIQRHALITEAVYNTSQATFDDTPTGSELPYHKLELDFGAQIFNEVTVSRDGGVERTVSDSDSETSYGLRTLTKSGLLMDTDLEAKSAAEWLLGKFRQPDTVVRRMELRPVGTDALWGQVLVRDLMERVTVQFDPPGAGDSFSQEAHIQGIEHRFRPRNWETSWWVSPADTTLYMEFGDAVTGKLGTGVLAY